MEKDFNYYHEIMTQGADSILDFGEDMAVAYQYSPRRIYLVNRKKEFAWLVLDRDDIVQWDKKDVDFEKVSTLGNNENATVMYAPYGFNISWFKNGRALVSWTLYPDGQYFADEDGYGMEDNEESKVYAFVNQQCEIVVPFQPMTSEQIAQYQNMPKRRRMAVITGLGIHNEANRFNMDTDNRLQPGNIHKKIAAFQHGNDMTVITTCRDRCHERAGSQQVIRLLTDQPEQELIRQAIEAVRQADVIVLMGCQAVMEPVRSLMPYVRPTSRLYVCRYNDGEGRLPHMHNVVRAFAYSTFEPLEEGILSVMAHLGSFPLED